MFLQIAVYLGTMALSYALAPKPPKPKAAAFADFEFPVVEEGTPQIVVFGDVWLTDWCVIGVGNYRTQAIVVKQKRMGGLFGSQKTTTGYRYLMSLHMGLCRGLDDLVEIKVSDAAAFDGTIAATNMVTINIDKPQLFGGDTGEGGIQGNLIVMRGAADQAVLSQLAAMYDTQVPAYRGVTTFFYDGLICSNSPYPKPWSFRARRTNADWDGGIWYASKLVIWLDNNKIKAMNPAHIIYQAQTDRYWGRGFLASQLDLGSFQAAADQLHSEGFGLCLGWRRQNSLSEFLQEVLNTIGAALFVDRTTGLWRLNLIRDNYNLSTVPSFDYSNGLLEIIEDSNSTSDLASNKIVVSYRDPITNQDKPAHAENIAAIQQHGVILENKTYAGIPTFNLAGRIAARDLKISQSSLKRFKLVFNRRGYAIQPVSVFKLNVPEQGIESIVVRVVRVDHDTVTNGKITVTVVQDVFGMPATNYVGEQHSLWQPPNQTALPVTVQKIYEVPYAELLREFTQSEILGLGSNSFFGVLAKQPGSLHLDFSILAKLSTESAYTNVGNGDFAFVSEITTAIPLSAEDITVVVSDTIYNVEIGDRGLIGDEIVYISAIDISANTLTLARAWIDTVPASHESGSKLWIYSNAASVAERAFEAAKIVNIKALTRTTQNELSVSLAQVISYTMKNRINRPYPPCAVKINNLNFPSEVTGDLNITWSHRNRMQQTDIDMNGWTHGSVLAEQNTIYNLKIYDANNSQLLDVRGIEVTNYKYNVPRVFDGEMVTILDIPMTGTNNSKSFNDVSENHFAIQNNYGALVKTESEAIGGSSAFFDKAILKTNAEYGKLDIYSDDHCIELRIKTASSTDFLGDYPNVLYLRVSHDRLVGVDNISLDYSIALQAFNDSIVIMINGYLAGTGIIVKSITHTVSGLSSDTYYDIAIQCIKTGTVNVDGTEFTVAELQLYCDGINVHSDILHLLSWEYACSLNINLSPNYVMGSKIAVNGLRMTKRTGGRYSGNYTPQPFVSGLGDVYWNDVVLFLPMTGSNNAHNFIDVSINPVVLSSTDMVATQTDSSAHGGSVTYFYHPMLQVLPQPIFNLIDKSFVIDGRVKCEPGTIFQFTSAMSLSIGQYALTLYNFDAPENQTVTVNLTAGINPDWTPDRYFNFKIIRNASTGITTLWFNEKSASAQFNPSASPAPSILIGFPISNEASFNGLVIQTADEDAALIPNVVNPLRIELESERDGYTNWQTYKSFVTVV